MTPGDIELPKAWVECRLGDVLNYGATLKAEPEEIPPDAWVLELEDVEKGTSKVLRRAAHAERQSKSTKNRFFAGDVLYGKLRPYLNKVVLAHESGYCTTEIIPLSPPSGLDGRYLLYWMKHPRFLEYATSASHGLNMPRLGTEAGKMAPFVLAPFAEQKRIADKLEVLLARVCACRERIDRVPGIIKRFRQSVLAAATTGELTREWREARGLEEWSKVELESVASDFSYGSAAKSAKAGSVPVLRMGNIQDGLLDWAGLAFTSNAAEIERYRLSSGDVLFNRTNSPELVGKTAVFRGERDAIYAGYLIRVRCGERLLPDYLNYCLGSPAGRDYCWRVKSDGVSQSNINAKKLAAFKFLLPSIAEQEEIVRRVEGLLSQNRALSVRAGIVTRQVERLVPSVLEKAFQGQLVPQDPGEEPAGRLLARVAIGRATLSNKPKRQRAPRAPKETAAMTKSRHDEDVKGQPYLAGHLRKLGAPATAEVLFKAAELPVADFYKQLAWEVTQGHVKDNRDTLESGHAAG